MEPSVVRISILRCDRERFDEFRQRMRGAEETLAAGLEALKGCRAYFAGADEATSSFTNTSIWDSLEAARQMDTFGPMLELAHQFAEAGARFDRPIMNHTVLWQIGKAVP
jgi:hypothetical protein